MSKVLITVTEEDIQNGTNSGDSCPVFFAANRVIENVAHVTHSHIITNKDWGSRIRLPDKAETWIWNFDAGKVVESFSFEVEIA